MVRLLLLAACCSAATDVERWEDRWSSGAWDDGWYDCKALFFGVFFFSLLLMLFA